jgi:hypothetical protein
VKAKAKAAGFDLHIVKPIDLNELSRVVTRSRADNRVTSTMRP